MKKAAARSPDWDHLFKIAAAQDGLFTTQQVAEAVYSPQLLAPPLGVGRMVRIRHGAYRLVAALDALDRRLVARPIASDRSWTGGGG